jgi:poly(3-hydroxybutyrate) depolymerase
VVVLHGGGTVEDNGANDMRTVVDMETEGDTRNGGNGVLIAYPRSKQQGDGAFQWNFSPEACAVIGLSPCPEDRQFVNAVIADIKATQSVNPANVALAGHSGGGVLALWMLCTPGATNGNPHATVAWAVAATLTAGHVAGCTNTTPTTLIIISGTDDSAVRYAGGAINCGIGVGNICSDALHPGFTDLLTLPVEYAAFQVIALGARAAPRNVASDWTSVKFAYHAPDGNCWHNSQHLRSGAPDVVVGTVGPGVALPIHTPPPDGCYSTGGTTPLIGAAAPCAGALGDYTNNGGGHRWPGYCGGYGTGKPTTFFNTSSTVLATVSGP